MASKRRYSVYKVFGNNIISPPARHVATISAYNPKGVLTYLVEGGYEGTFIWGTPAAWNRYYKSGYKDVRGMYRAVLSK